MVNNINIGITQSYDQFVSAVSRKEIEINDNKVIVKGGTLAERVASSELSGIPLKMADRIDNYKVIFDQQYLGAKKTISENLTQYKVRYLAEIEQLASKKIDTSNHARVAEQFSNFLFFFVGDLKANNEISREEKKANVKNETAATSGWFGKFGKAVIEKTEYRKKVKKMRQEELAVAEIITHESKTPKERSKLRLERRRIREEQQLTTANLLKNQDKFNANLKKIESPDVILKLIEEINAQLETENNPESLEDLNKQLKSHKANLNLMDIKAKLKFETDPDIRAKLKTQLAKQQIEYRVILDVCAVK